MMAEITETMVFVNARKVAEARAREMIAGHCTLITWWALRHAGVLEALLKGPNGEAPGIEPLVHATRTNMSADVLAALLEYLSKAGLVAFSAGRAQLTEDGRALLEHGDGVLQMVRAYQPVLETAEHLLAKLRPVGGNGGGRKSDYLAASQGKRYAEEVFPAVREVVAGHKMKHLIDISCGAGELLIHVAQKVKQAVGVGIAGDAATVRKANAAIAAADLEKRLIAVTAPPRDVCVETQRTFERIGVSRQLWNGLDCVIALQVFSELAGGATSGEGDVAVAQALAGARRHFSKAKLLLIEPVPSAKFEKNFYAAELGLLLKLTRANPWDAQKWRAMLAAAKWNVVEEVPLVTDGLTIFLCAAG